MEGDGHGGGGVLEESRRGQGGERSQGDEQLAYFLLLWGVDGHNLLVVGGVQEDFAYVVGGPEGGDELGLMLCATL